MSAPGIPPRWGHQQEAFEFAHRRFGEKQHGVMLALAMGCGKSRIAIDLAVSENAEQLLIVCPLRVVPVWEQQLARFAPGHFHILGLDERGGAVKNKHQKAAELYHWSQQRHQPVAILINYDSARVEPFAGWAASRIWSMVIADELHRAKQSRGRTSMWLAKLGIMAHRRLGLTGTPMPHTPLDIWSQFRFLNPFHLERSYWQFKTRYAVMGGYFNKQIVRWQNLDELEKRFRELAFRVDDSVLDLPPEMDETRSANLSENAARIYRQMERDMIAWIAAGENVTAANALVRLVRLAQITGGAINDESGQTHIVDHAKEDLARELLEDLKEPVVVFCRFRADLEAVNRAARRAGENSLELSGTRDDRAQWIADGPRVLAVQIQAGGVGVDLSRARIAIYYSHGFSLAEYLQSRARIHRPPQTRPCLFYHLEIRNSIDQYIRCAVEARRDLVESVLADLKEKGATHVVHG